MSTILDIIRSGMMSATASKPAVIGLWGIQSSGKSTLLEKFKSELGTYTFTFYDGSQALADVLSGAITVRLW
jgi:adenylylsulfate kinase-like enzyme